ncbi:choice-of-anchor Q domain-containing protein, partial [Metapseudomonas otitidis]
TFTGNEASFGSAIGNDGVLTLANATLSGNRQPYYGQGTFNNGQYQMGGTPPQALLVNVTIANNSGGYGLINLGKVTLRNSIIAGNLDEDLAAPMNCDNRGAQAQYKAIGLLLGTGPGNCTGELYVEQADVMTQVLYPLADNNGRTQTHALRPHSPAVDAGIGTCTARDQRGSKRPRDGDGDGVARCDLGAYERPKPWVAKP